MGSHSRLCSGYSGQAGAANGGRLHKPSRVQWCLCSPTLSLPWPYSEGQSPCFSVLRKVIGNLTNSVIRQPF